VRDTPISEMAIVGSAVGAAMAGLRPVVELMYLDFLGVCFDQLLNQAAKLRYMTGGGVSMPIVFRTQTGAGRSAGAQHSQSLEAVLAHIPGLEVYMPADGRDAADLLAAAIAADHPVVFVENRRLYGRRDPDWGREPLPPGKARVIAAGTDLTIVTWGRMVEESRKALEILGDEASVELIDLRTLVPLDVDALTQSVARTGRCLVVHEAVERFGPGGEIVSRIIDGALFEIDGPVRRFGARDTPMPYSPPLESAVLPAAEGIAAAAREVLAG
jgi:pyruvate/2-oxoglutarate/acetoin dehydrogenase E1 component